MAKSPSLIRYLSASMVAILLGLHYLYGDWVMSPLTQSGNDSWYQTLHTTYNTFALWRLDPIATAIGITNSSLYYSAVFLSGALFLVLLTPTLQSVPSATAVILLNPLLLYLFGNDYTLLGPLAWIPWLSLVLSHLKKSRGDNSIALILILIFLSIRVSGSSNQFALLSLVSAYLVEMVLSHDRFRLPPFPLVLLTLIPAIVVLFRVPDPTFPDYPPLAHVVSDDGLPGKIGPMVTLDTPIPFIDRAAVKTSLRGEALLLLLMSLLPVGFAKWKKTKSDTNLVIPFLLSLCVALDVVASEAVAQVSPLAALSRLIPGLFLFPLAPFAWSISLLLLLLLFARLKAGILSILVLCTLVAFSFNRERGLHGGVLLSDNQGADLSSIPIEILSSPSMKVVRALGPWTVADREALISLEETSLATVTAKFEASERDADKQIRRLGDDRKNSRWSPMKGKQEGNEWVVMSLAYPHRIRGLVLSPGTFVADFPRGIRISSKLTCDNSSPWITLFEQKDWQGALEWTPRGFPYFGAQRNVRIYFPNEHEVRCLRIEQIGKSDNFDWSVAEILLLTPRR